MSAFKNVAIFGATGTLGYPITNMFLEDKSYSLTAVRRKDASKNEKANTLEKKGVKVVSVDYKNATDVESILKGIDVVVDALSANCFDEQYMVLEASKKAGVKRFITSDYGIDSELYHEHMIIGEKKKFAEKVKESGMEYTQFAVGLFTDLLGIFGINIKERKASIYGDGTLLVHMTALEDVGRYTVESLRTPYAKNRYVKVAGDKMTINEIIKVVEKHTGSKFEISHLDIEQEIKSTDMIRGFLAYVVQAEKFTRLDNKEFPNVKPLTLKQFLAKYY